ncbi:MAG: T9SS C-terminal target domain-containing protein, partial [Chitinophagia bacterium]|nr:T9SS C-terminal target domain-containing protein [Chitinophagia bacterium]
KEAATQGDNRFELKKGATTASTTLNVLLSPNPAAESATITITGVNATTATVKVIDVRGVVVHQTTISGTLTTTIPVHKLASGIYTVQIETDGKKIVRKLVKE